MPADISDPRSLICAAKKPGQEGSLDINGILTYSQLLQTHFREMLFEPPSQLQGNILRHVWKYSSPDYLPVL